MTTASIAGASPKAKRKPGPQRLANPSPNTERQRRFVERQSLERVAAEVLASEVARGVKAQMPDFVPNELIELASAAANETSRILSTEGPKIVQRLADAAKNGDMAAAQILSRFLMPSVTKISLPRSQGVDQLCSTVLDQVASGELSLEVADKVLSIAQKIADVQLSGSIVARIEQLKNQISAVRESRPAGEVIDVVSRVVSLEELV